MEEGTYGTVGWQEEGFGSRAETLKEGIRMKKRIIEYAKKSSRVHLVLYIFWMVGLFSYTERFGIEENSLYFVNFLIGVLIAFAVYFSLSDKKVRKKTFVLLFSTLFVLNRFYDAAVVMEQFHISMYAFAAIICGAGIIVLLPLLWKVLEDSFPYNTQPDAVPRKQPEKRTTVCKPKIQRPSEYIIYTSENLPEKEERTKDDNSEKNRKEKVKNIWKGIGYAGIFLLLLITPAVMLYMLLKNEIKTSLDEIQKNIVGSGIAFVIIFLILILLIATVALFLIDLVKTIYNAIFGKKKDAKSVLYFGTLLMIIWLLYKNNFEFTQDSMLNLLVSGDIFSFPFIIVILLLVILMLFRSMIEILDDDKETKNKIKILLRNMIFDTIKSMLEMVKFVTADFLSALKNLVGDDISKNNEPD